MWIKLNNAIQVPKDVDVSNVGNPVTAVAVVSGVTSRYNIWSESKIRHIKAP